MSYSKSDVDHNGVNLGNRTNIDSYLGLLYGSLRLDSWYLNGTLGLGKHNYESLRRVLGSDAQGSYNAWQYSVRVDAGLPLNLSTAVITPVVAMTYSYLNQSGYAETGMGALNIDGKNTNSFRTGLGAKAHFPLYQGNFSAGLELRRYGTMSLQIRDKTPRRILWWGVDRSLPVACNSRATALA